MVQSRESICVYLDAHLHGVVTCVKCGSKRPVNMTPYPGNVGAKVFKVRCDACATVFGVHFEARRQARRTVQLPGALVQVGAKHVLASIIVTSLSLGGVGFRTRTPVALQPGEIYDVIFFLDDADHTLIFQTIVLRRMQGQEGGAEFCAQDIATDDLDYYLISLVAPAEQDHA